MFSFEALPKNATVRFLALGDSYTIGESVSEFQRWPEQLANALQTRGVHCERPEVVAMTGWRTDQLRDAVLKKGFANDFDLVSLLIGVNNQYQRLALDAYAMEFKALLRLAIESARNDPGKVFVLSIPDYGYTPFGEKNKEAITKEIDAFNAINRQISEANGVRYVYITDITRLGLADRTLLAEDGLHPSGKMYALWVERILECIGG